MITVCLCDVKQYSELNAGSTLLTGCVTCCQLLHKIIWPTEIQMFETYTILPNVLGRLPLHAREL